MTASVLSVLVHHFSVLINRMFDAWLDTEAKFLRFGAVPSAFVLTHET